MIAQVVARVMFLPSLAYNVYMEQTTERRWWDRVDERVILGAGNWDPFFTLTFLVGAIPFRSTYTASLVSDEGITGVVAVNEPYELRLCSYQREGWKELGVSFTLYLICSLRNKSLSTSANNGMDDSPKKFPGGFPSPVHC